MDELVSQMPESSMQSSYAVNEVFTQVMGPERLGRARTYGFGLSPRDLFGHKKSEEMQAMQSQLDEQLSRHKAEMEAKQLEMEAQQAQMEKQMSQMEAKFDTQQRQFEVFSFKCVQWAPDASSTHNINSHRSLMRSESRSPVVRDTEFRGHSRAFSFGQVHRQKRAKLQHVNNNVVKFPPK
ncbi:unnamed protein product [Ilex paraguariensis]|uniref:Uncharacterized protein n=1 Tax=Ilex paraguariensis TaxID=185542 RepID=A0ABC8RQA3_9AQUA